MGEKTKIAWTDSTFSPWWGCTKVSPGCEECYAETTANRFGTGWGPSAPRRFFGDKHWNEPLKWNRKAAESGKPWRVFCGSMCDIAEDNPEVKPHLPRLWKMIQDTRFLTWLLTTKRPQELFRMFEAESDRLKMPFRYAYPNVTALVTTENQEWLEKRLRHIRMLSSIVRNVGLSAEPLLGPLNLNGVVTPFCGGHAIADHVCSYCRDWKPLVSWVIVGGESSQNNKPARPFEFSWARDILRQCRAENVAYFYKQNGSNAVGGISSPGDSKGVDPASHPADLRVYEFPRA